MTNRRQPVLFVSHGSPMHALGGSAAAQAWAEMAQKIGKPRAILMVSAHWETNIPMITGAPALETIHDFGGFPDELYAIHYAAPAHPALAGRIQTLLREAGISAGIDAQRGLDHGAWVPLLHMYPQADVPVLQISMQSDRGARHQFAVGQALAPLRDEGVLIIGSGHMTHNLRDYFTLSHQGGVAAYAKAFRDWVDARIQDRRIEELLDWETLAPSALRAHPTPEHFLPLFDALGAAGANYTVESIYTGFDGGVLAMDAYALD